MEKEFGNNHLGTLRFHLRLAGLYKTLGQPEKALLEYRAVQEAHESGEVFDDLGPMTDTETLEESLLYQAMIHVETRNFDRALPILEKYMALLEEVGSPGSLKAGQAMVFLAAVLQQQGDFEKAVALYQKALKISDELGSEDMLYLSTGFDRTDRNMAEPEPVSGGVATGPATGGG